MKEFVLTQPYSTVEEMLNSGEVAVYKEELQQGNIEKYAIVSRIGNRYDLNGKKIENYADNPFIAKEDVIVFTCDEITNEDVIEEASITVEKILEEEDMKYCEIEMFIDKEIEKAVAEIKEKHAQEIAVLKEKHAEELANAKYEAKAELIAKLNA